MKNQEYLLGFLCSILLLLAIISYQIQIQNNELDKSETFIDIQISKPYYLFINVDGCVKKTGKVAVSGISPMLIHVINAAGGLSCYANTDVINFADSIRSAKSVYIPGVYQDNIFIVKDKKSHKKKLKKDKKKKKKKHKKHKKHKLSKKELLEKLPFHSIVLNKASKEQLMMLPGIGEKMADRIIEYRTQTPFASNEEIINIKGIGKKKMEKILPYLK